MLTIMLIIVLLSRSFARRKGSVVVGWRKRERERVVEVGGVVVNSRCARGRFE